MNWFAIVILCLAPADQGTVECKLQEGRLSTEEACTEALSRYLIQVESHNKGSPQKYTVEYADCVQISPGEPA